MTRYDRNGWVEDLPSLLRARGSHGCALYITDTGDRTLYISKVMQKVFVEVQEEGSEAAAATVTTAVVTTSCSLPMQFRVDHPFIFMIRDSLTGLVLFQGRVVNPTLTAE